MVKALKFILIGVFVMFLFVPITQQFITIYTNDQELEGAYIAGTDTCLNSSTWHSRIYQDKKEGFLNENFGFRNLLVKLNNQIDYSVFEDNNLPDIFRGKNGYLFNSSFFNSFSGRSYNGDRYADSVFNTVKTLNDYLVARNKKLLVCFAPCKESYYTEFLPDTCLPFIKKQSYYSYYKQKLIANNIPLLDYNSYFLSLKKNIPHPLFAKGAVHWTTYGTYIALDTLLERISFELHKKTYQIRIKSVQISDTARANDDDITRTMNLLYKVKSEKLAYPEVEYVNSKDSCYTPKVVIVGDSYFSCLNETWIPLSFFSKESYFLYYYIRSIPYDSRKQDLLVKELNMQKELENTDIVILFYTIGRLTDFPNGCSSMINAK